MVDNARGGMTADQHIPIVGRGGSTPPQKSASLGLLPPPRKTKSHPSPRDVFDAQLQT